MANDDTFQWIAQIPSISNLSSDDHSFPELDDSLSRPASSIAAKNIFNSDNLLSTTALYDLGNLDLEDGLKRNREREPQFCSMVPSPPTMSENPPTLSSSTKTESSAETPMGSPTHFRRLPSVVRTALAPTPSPPKLENRRHMRFCPELSPIARLPKSDYSMSPNLPSPSIGHISNQSSQMQLPKTTSPIANFGYKTSDSDIGGDISDIGLTSWDNVCDLVPPMAPDGVVSGFGKPGFQDRYTASQKPGPTSSRIEESQKWQTVYDICKYFDDHLSEPIDADSTLNVADMQEAATRLGYTIPLDVRVVETLMQIGWRIPDYRESTMPWMNAYETVKLNIDTRNHEFYLIKLRAKQASLSNQSRMKLLKRDMLTRWLNALSADILLSDRILEIRMNSVFKPRYFKLWKLRTQFIAKSTEQADGTRREITCICVMQNWRSDLQQSRFSHSKSEILRRRYLSTRILADFVQNYEHNISQQSRARDVRQKLLRRNFFDILIEKAQIRKASKTSSYFLARKYFHTMSGKYRLIVELNEQSRESIRKAAFKCWMKNMNFTKKLEAIAINCRVFDKELQKYTLIWLSKLRIKWSLARLDHTVGLKISKHWRVNSQTKVLVKQRDRHLQKSIISRWRTSLNALYRAQDFTSMVIEASDIGCKCDFLELWIDRFHKEKDSYESTILLNHMITQRKFYRALKTEMLSQSEQRHQAETVNIHLLSCKYFVTLKRRSAHIRDFRLESLLSNWTTSRDRRAVGCTLKKWRMRTQGERQMTQSIQHVLAGSKKEMILLNWQRSLVNFSSTKAAAPHICNESTSRKVSRLWRDRQIELEEMSQTVENISVARLGLVMRQEIRKWQMKCATDLSQRVQAETYMRQQLRRRSSNIIDEWRARTAYLSPTCNSSIKDGFGDTSITGYFNPVDSPSKFSAISPQFIVKWKAKGGGETPNRSSQRIGIATPTRNQATPNTPTKSFRRTLL